MIASAPSRVDYLGLSLSAVRRGLTAKLAKAGIEDPDYEARLLLQLALGIDTVTYIIQENRKLTSKEANHLENILGRRLSHEPLSRIEGVRNFYGNNFFINTSVLDPRPESEVLIDFILELANSREEKNWPHSILDVGTGSGCLLITLLGKFPFARGVGNDILDGALEVARFNAHKFKLENRVTFEQRRSLEGITETFDLLVSNPPYIPTRQLQGLEPAVKDFDPSSALDGGEDGLVVYRQIASQLTQVVPAGWAVFEVGFDQANLVADLFQKELKGRIKDSIIHNDLSGNARCVAVQTQN